MEDSVRQRLPGVRSAIRLAPAGPTETSRQALAESRGYMLNGVRYQISPEGR